MELFLVNLRLLMQPRATRLPTSMSKLKYFIGILVVGAIIAVAVVAVLHVVHRRRVEATKQLLPTVLDRVHEWRAAWSCNDRCPDSLRMMGKER